MHRRGYPGSAQIQMPCVTVTLFHSAPYAYSCTQSNAAALKSTVCVSRHGIMEECNKLRKPHRADPYIWIYAHARRRCPRAPPRRVPERLQPHSFPRYRLSNLSCRSRVILCVNLLLITRLL